MDFIVQMLKNLGLAVLKCRTGWHRAGTVALVSSLVAGTRGMNVLHLRGETGNPHDVVHDVCVARKWMEAPWILPSKTNSLRSLEELRHMCSSRPEAFLNLNTIIDPHYWCCEHSDFRLHDFIAIW